MAQGVLHRAGVAIVLVATLLLPYGRCQAPARAASHDCCVHSAPMATAGTNCCIVRSQLPAIVVERAAPVSQRLVSAVFVVPPAEPAMRFETTAEAAVAHHPSPPGASVLRI
jgi:hypothetical protein